MISKEEFDKGIKLEEEISPLEILDKTKMAMTTKEITVELKTLMPHAGVTYGAIKQKLSRYEKSELVVRKKVEGKNYWLRASKK
jgi:predicted transcriptional regulator